MKTKCRQDWLRAIIEQTRKPWFQLLALIATAFIVGAGTHNFILRVAGYEMVRTQQSLADEVTRPTAPPARVSLTDDQKRVFHKLIEKSRGIGSGVAVSPFHYWILKDLNISDEVVNTAIAFLQSNGLVELDEELGFDDSEGRTSPYPVYRVTSEGWRVWREYYLEN